MRLPPSCLPLAPTCENPSLTPPPSPPVSFLWPLIIAGSILERAVDRKAVELALDTLRSYTCFDFQSGQEILREVWAARDRGDRNASFRDVAPRCGAVVL